MPFITPTFLSGATLGVYVLIPHTITVVEAFTLVAMVNLARAPLNQLPQAVAGLSKAKIAYARIDAFLASSEQDYDAERYAQVLDALQLTMDLKTLLNGDSTEIGERGTNLSGGQKARVAIARAMYRTGTDVLILDDPLSAVDPHVAHAIFEKCIVGMAGDQTRLVVVNSHYDLLPNADHIVVMDDGVIIAAGPYSEIVGQVPHILD